MLQSIASYLKKEGSSGLKKSIRGTEYGTRTDHHMFADVARKDAIAGAKAKYPFAKHPNPSKDSDYRERYHQSYDLNVERLSQTK
jgi:hypothetical protein